MALSDNLVAYWALEEGTGATRVDSHTVGPFHMQEGNGLVPVHQVAGVSTGFAAKSTFTTDMGLETSAPTNSRLNVGGSFSASLWFKNDDDTGVKDLVSLWEDPAANGKQWALRYHTADQAPASIFRFFVSSDGSAQAFVDLARNAGVDTWRHVVVVYNNEDNYLRIVVDNATSISQANTDNLHTPGESPFRLFQLTEGAFNNTDAQSMDEVAFWDRALTDADITELHNSGTPLTYEETVGGGSGGAGGAAAAAGGGGGSYAMGPGWLWR